MRRVIIKFHHLSSSSSASFLQNVEDQVNNSNHFPAVLSGYETWSLTHITSEEKLDPIHDIVRESLG